MCQEHADSLKLFVPLAVVLLFEIILEMNQGSHGIGDRELGGVSLLVLRLGTRISS
jgi:hypothetical protein